MYFLLGLMITSASCDLAISTNVLAAGWTISNVFKMVAPSFDIVAFPTKNIFNNYKVVKRFITNLI
jgi:hypothetical protein